MSKNDENYQNSDIKIKDEPVEESSTSIHNHNLHPFNIKQEPEEEFELQIPTNQEFNENEQLEEARSCKKLVIFPKEYVKAAPYMCQTCMKRFSDKKILQQHRTTHEKTTICEICKVEVKQNLLNSHMKTNHVLRKSFECPTCHAQFKVETNLQHHMKKHDIKFVYKIEK
ncbi:hypothetical protein ACKWTF_015233 [Chironomus riparius]